MEKKLLLLGGSLGTCNIIQYAKSQGIHTIVTDWLEPEHSEAKRLADEYWMISFGDIDALEQKCRTEKVSAVMAASSDYAIERMMELCERLHLPCYCTGDSFHYSRDKADFKKVCKEAGMAIPEDYELSDALSEEELERVDFPVVVKPVDQTNSRGITFCNNKEELVDAYHKARTVSDNPKIIVEKKIEGKEFVAYYALADGEASFLFLHSVLAPDKETVGNCFATSNVTRCVDDFIMKANAQMIEAIKRCGCRENIVWVQLMLAEDGNFYVLEMGYRLAADMMPTEYSYIGDLDLIKWGVECAFGKKHTKEDLPKGLEHPMQKYIYSCMLCCGKSGIVKEIAGLEELQENKSIHIRIHCHVGEELKGGEKVMGCVGFSANSLDELCKLIDKVNGELQIKNQDDENMILPYMTAERFLLEELG